MNKPLDEREHMQNRSQRSVVVTGLGAITPHGLGITPYWQGITSGRSSIVPLPDELLPADRSIQVAGIVSAFKAEEHIERKLVQRTDRATHFTLAAIQQALADARLEITPEIAPRVGAVIANTMGGVNYVLRQLHALYTRGPRAMSAYTAIAWLHVANVGQTAIRYGLQGYCKVPVNDTASGLNALGMAYRAIRRGEADVILAGGSEAFLHPFILQTLGQRDYYFHGSSLEGYRPFDSCASGLVLAEGAGMLVLEAYEHAQRRGATIYGEIAGYSQTNDATGIALPCADGTHYARAMRLALREADLQPSDLAYTSLDGRAIPASDEGEAHALHLLAHPGLPIASVPHTTIGHSYAANGALAAIAALLALRHRQIPPSIRSTRIDPAYQLDLVRAEPRPLSPHARGVLLAARALGGSNVALALIDRSKKI